MQARIDPGVAIASQVGGVEVGIGDELEGSNGHEPILTVGCDIDELTEKFVANTEVCGAGTYDHRMRFGRQQ